VITFLTAAVVLLCLLCVFDLLLTVGAIRRLRQHTEQLANLRTNPASTGLAVGGAVGAFESRTIDGQPVTSAGLTGDTVVAFFSTSCTACHDRLPEFLEHVAGLPAHIRVLVVVAGPAEKTPTMVPALETVAEVVREEDDQDVMGTAFSVRGHPVLFRLEDGQVAAFGTTISALGAPVTPSRSRPPPFRC
jgi:cytochrome oxidase Cu insertion factor (SCO1/SenC/PrrC family)